MASQWARKHRHAHAGDADADHVVLEDLPRLLDHLGLFVVVTGLGIDGGVVAEQVEGVGMRHHLRRIDLPAQIGAGRIPPVRPSPRRRRRCRLIGRDDHPPDAVLPVDRPQRHQCGDRRAVRLGDDALVVADAAAVDLGDHQRHVRVHAEGGGIVDDDGAGLDRDRRVLLGNAAAGREQRDVDAVEGAVGEFLDHDLLPRKESVLPADRALASAFSLPTRKPRLSMVAMNSRPTAPVTPAMATTGSSLTLLSFLEQDCCRQQKSPGPS